MVHPIKRSLHVHAHYINYFKYLIKLVERMRKFKLIWGTPADFLEVYSDLLTNLSITLRTHHTLEPDAVVYSE